MAVVLKPGCRIVYREAHLRFLPGDAQLAEQTHKARIGAVVVDDKPGIDGPGALRRCHIHSCGMASWHGSRFKQGNLMMTGQPPGAGQPGNTAADNRNLHERTILRSSVR